MSQLTTSQGLDRWVRVRPLERAQEGGSNEEEVEESDYPKKGKTRIPTRLVSNRAVIDIGYSRKRRRCQYLISISIFLLYCAE